MELMAPTQPFLAGKPIQVFDTGRGRRTTPDELRMHLRRYAVVHTLKVLGEVSGKMWTV